jgi:hypothetical protein
MGCVQASYRNRSGIIPFCDFHTPRFLGELFCKIIMNPIFFKYNESILYALISDDAAHRAPIKEADTVYLLDKRVRGKVSGRIE